MFQPTRKVKDALGRVKVIKNLFLSKLDTLLLKVDDLTYTSNTLLETTTYLIQSQQELRQKLDEEISNSETLLESSLHLIEAQQTLKQQLFMRLAPVDTRLQEVDTRLQELEAKLQALRELQELQKPQHEIISARSSRTTEAWAMANPEADLLAYLYSFLPSRVAIDIGANRGQMSEVLIHAGFNVIAFEPYAPVYEELRDRFQDSKQFTAHCLAIGKTDGVLPLNVVKDLSDGQSPDHPSVYNSLAKHPMPDYLVFGESVDVKVRSLESLHQGQEVPSEVGLVKIDTEGFDLEVIRGMGSYTYPVVLTEFWDSEMVLGGGTYTIQDLVQEMRGRGYHWHIVIYRDAYDNVRFYSNSSVSVPKSWGNVLFFQELDVFNAANKWCSATLSPTYFRG